MQRVAWEDVSDLADLLFCVWRGSPELGWARSMWRRLGAARLTRFQQEVDRPLVQVRLMALGEIYRDFCAVAWREGGDPESANAAWEVRLSPFRLAQYLGPEFMPEAELSDDDLFRAGVEHLIDEVRDEVVRAIFRHSAHEAEVFTMLWLSTSSKTSGLSWKELDDEAIDLALNDVSPEKAEAYMWVTEKMPPYR